jgi:hypothetical protein
VAATQQPFFHTPFGQPSRPPPSEVTILASRDRFQHPLELRPNSPSSSSRWSRESSRSESSLVKEQMSNHGSVASFPPRTAAGEMTSSTTTSFHPSPSQVHHSQLPPRDRAMGGQSIPGPILPPPRMNSHAGGDSDRRSSRTLASVHSILNPSFGDDTESRGRRRSAAQMEESAPISPPPGSLPSSRPSSSGGIREASPPGGQGGRLRRILTPISPTLQRTTSITGIVTGTIDAHTTPFLMSSGSRIHAAEPGTSVALSLPAAAFAPVTQRQSYGYSHAPSTHAGHNFRRQSIGVPQSARASPTPSGYSSFSRSGHPSPALSYPSSVAQTPPGSFSLGPSQVSPQISAVPPVNLDETPHGIPVVSAGQANYELMQLNTSIGTVSVGHYTPFRVALKLTRHSSP